MSYARCQGLMVKIDMEDGGSSSHCISGWHCILCGDVTDAGIRANRKHHHEPRFGVDLVRMAHARSRD
jgi:hypothetical protein